MNSVLSFLLRSAEAACAAAPFLICGLLLAGACRVLVGRRRMQKLLAGDSLSGPVRGWGLGLLLPVCSLGVLPVARELLRAEVPRRTVFAFLLAAPLFHPLTLAGAARAHFAQWEGLARRLPMGSLLRGSASGDQRVSAQLLRQSLIAVQASLAGDDPEETARLLEKCELAYRQCRDVFDGQPLVLHAEGGPAMPVKVTDEAERELYLTPGGLYSEADIAANGRQTASVRYAGFRSAHVMNPPAGSLLCPVTATKANPACTWIVNGREYQFCCPPCIDEFVRTAKESPEEIQSPDDYVKR